MLTLTNPAPLPIAFVAAFAVAVAAWQLRSLTWSGAAVATLMGVGALATSWGMGFFLIGWFVLASAISKVGRRRKARRVGGVVVKGGQRDALQVLANGGVFLACLLAAFAAQDMSSPQAASTLLVAAAGSLAAAGADTWATEIGTLVGGNPVSVRTGARVPAGTSGAITVSGTLAMILSASGLSLAAAALSAVPFESRTILAVALGGIVGAVADTLVGAWLQETRQCLKCGMFTEQTTHLCGGQTTYYSGIGGLNNDAVNALCSLTGAAAAAVTVLL